MSKYYALISIIYYALVVFISMMFIKNIFIYIFTLKKSRVISLIKMIRTIISFNYKLKIKIV